jgi:hypothetical protein
MVQALLLWRRLDRGLQPIDLLNRQGRESALQRRDGSKGFMADDGDDMSRATQTGTDTLFQLNGRMLEKKRCNDDNVGAKSIGSRHTLSDTARHITFRHSSTPYLTAS